MFDMNAVGSVDSFFNEDELSAVRASIAFQEETRVPLSDRVSQSAQVGLALSTSITSSMSILSTRVGALKEVSNRGGSSSGENRLSGNKRKRKEALDELLNRYNFSIKLKESITHSFIKSFINKNKRKQVILDNLDVFIPFIKQFSGIGMLMELSDSWIEAMLSDENFRNRLLLVPFLLGVVKDYGEDQSQFILKFLLCDYLQYIDNNTLYPTGITILANYLERPSSRLLLDLNLKSFFQEMTQLFLQNINSSGNQAAH